MASIRDLKKDINFVLGDIIEAVYQWEAATDNSNSEEGSSIIDKSIQAFDELMGKVHQQGIEDKKTHFKSIRSELEEKATTLIGDLNKLS